MLTQDPDVDNFLGIVMRKIGANPNLLTWEVFHSTKNPERTVRN